MGPRSPAVRRYHRRFVPVMGAYVLGVGAATWAFRHLHPQGAVALALAMLPAIPILAAIGVVALYLKEETDEFLRMRVAHSLLWAIGLTLAACTVWGFLDNYGLVERLSLFYVVVAFCAAFGFCTCLLSWRYR
ncbi:MAG TPA: hypothetical protein VHX64_10590 [Caulobacteraceae bacterium]|nr:hypothetical protein [Caulobacteraceae bacterium]